MRAEVPAELEGVIAGCAQPSLVFSLGRIAANAEGIAAAAKAAGVTVLFAAKSFPHRRVRAAIGEHFAGFDVASSGELDELGAAIDGTILSLGDPTGLTAAADPARLARARRVIVSCETVNAVLAAPASAEIAIRISASITGRDPAIGAVLDGSGHRRSRFGLTAPDELRVIATGAGRPIGLHVHHGPVTATSGERFLATAQAALALAAEAGIAPTFLNLGGTWHGVRDLARAFAELRAAVPAGIELLVEPGRALTAGAGFACGRIVAAREVDDRSLRVSDLSRICHLRWSQVELVGSAPAPGAGRKHLVVGPTCFEEDTLGEWTTDPAQLALGAPFVLRDVSGYAVGWNTGFGGVAPAAVLVVDS